MISPKNILIRLILILASLCSTARGGEGYYCNTRDGACVPKRLTYGYTPTTWRRWPNEGTPSVARPAAEQIPTPAKQAPPAAGPGTIPTTPEDAPLMPDDAPLVPTDSVPGGSTPSAEPLLTPPFDDTPPAPPQGPESGANPPAATTAPGAMTTPKTLAEPPSRIQSALPDADPPPAMPDDDPFKDDPTGPPIPPDEPAKKRGARLTPSVDENIRTTATQWQSPAKTADVIVEGPQLKPIPAADEPRRLQPVDEKSAGTVALPPVNVPVKHNPLRAASQERRSERVVPTANWTVEQRASTTTTASRRNPLRSN